MGLFSKIKDAIFGHPKAAPTQTAQADKPVMPQMGEQPQATPVQPQAASQPVDVEAVLTDMAAEQGEQNLNWRTSIVDLLKVLNIDPSLDNRKELAREFGYTGELNGSAEMNIWLHKRVVQNLEGEGAKVPASMKN